MDRLQVEVLVVRLAGRKSKARGDASLSCRHLRFAGALSLYSRHVTSGLLDRALKQAEEELAATTRTALDAAAKRFMLAKTQLKAFDAVPADKPKRRRFSVADG